MPITGGEPPKAYQYNPIPKLENGDYDRELLKAQYMASSCIDWATFCRDRNYDQWSARRAVPVTTWQKEKKLKIAEEEADKLAAIMFERGFKWHNDVVKTLEEYPKSIDMCKALIDARMQELAGMYRDKQEGKKTGLSPKAGWAWDKVKNSDLVMLARATKDVTDAKHRALLIYDWTIKKAEDQSNIVDLVEQTAEGKGGIYFKVIGHEDALSSQDIQNMMDQYLDKPNPDPVDDGNNQPG